MKIVDLEIEKVTSRLAAKSITVELDETAKAFLIAEGYDPTYGARPMRRAVERHLEDPLAEHLLRGNIKEGDTVTVSKPETEKALTFAASDPSGGAGTGAEAQEPAPQPS
jgi:ATP-dependent Clp protease ATP-binding subunit ClpC